MPLYEFPNRHWGDGSRTETDGFSPVFSAACANREKSAFPIRDRTSLPEPDQIRYRISCKLLVFCEVACLCRFGTRRVNRHGMKGSCELQAVAASRSPNRRGEMNAGLIKAPARIKKFVPHSPVPSSGVAGVKQRRSAPTPRTESFDQLANDARNILSALKLYCELLAEPSVLTPGNRHYAQELEAISATALKLVERISAPRRARLEPGRAPTARRISWRQADVISEETDANGAADLSGHWPAVGVDDLGREILEMRPLLAAIAGPRVQLEIAAMPCGGRCRLSREDFSA